MEIPDVIAEPELRKWVPPAPTIQADAAPKKAGWWNKRHEIDCPHMPANGLRVRASNPPHLAVNYGAVLRFLKFDDHVAPGSCCRAGVFYCCDHIVGTGHGRKKRPQNAAPGLIRDAEIEGLLRQYTRPMFKAAGVNADSVKVYLIARRHHQRLRGGRTTHFYQYRLAHKNQVTQ